MNKKLFCRLTKVKGQRSLKHDRHVPDKTRAVCSERSLITDVI